jgi:DnaJ-class molecular chaperone
MVLRVVGEGSGESRSPGDLLLEIQVEPDSYFTRQGNDIYVEIPVPLTKVIHIRY